MGNRVQEIDMCNKHVYLGINASTMKPHQNLEVWKKSFSLVKKLYILTSKYPSEEKFGLTSQIRRACTSIPVNIAEGSARRSDKELQHFLYIALGSASELDTLLLLSRELDFITSDDFDSVSIDLELIFKLLLGFINMVKKRIG
ncbi:four helix bundle protein [Pedobacter mucosus]|uniref:four helix bundle protein n=1 Tax=Pedobacter mucosus TaxID=2895286 RepID=UPI001EE459B4|nr:four helix bundle protein [Pedobacter mucosus]UKT62692.1 four helix bundle protein [Pedobacter mucosus]